ncbi:MAG: toprim domain-containing protein [Thermoplasmata archaeon]|jgi:5S rRNA maturation endonuclease (ribonuclease M5)
MNDDRFLSLVDSLIEKNEYVPVIVEGIRDERSLRLIGLNGVIIIYNRGETLNEFSDRISRMYSEVIILFDNDRRGRYLTKSVKGLLESRGVKVDIAYRELIFTLLEIKGIEELFTFYEESLDRKINGKRRRVQ